MSYFNIIAANDEEQVVMRCYQKHKFNFVRIGKTYKFDDIINKGDTYWVVNSSVIVMTSSIVGCGDFEDIPLPENIPKAGTKRKLVQALQSPQKSTITGKIVSPLKLRREGTLPVRSLALKDESGLAKVALFEDNAKITFEHKKTLTVTAVFSKSYNKKTQLVTTADSACEFQQDDVLDVTVNDDDHLSDDDFKEEEDNTPLGTFVIKDIFEAKMYPCCATEACRKKKLQNKKCVICQEIDTKNKMGFMVTVNVENVESKQKKKITVFNDMVMTLFSITEEIQDEDHFINELCRRLPVQFLAHLSANRLFNVTDVKGSN